MPKPSKVDEAFADWRYKLPRGGVFGFPDEVFRAFRAGWNASPLCPPGEHEWNIVGCCAKCSITQSELIAQVKPLYAAMALEKSKKPRIILDFDGVIHRYDTPWSGDDTEIPDSLVQGSKEAITELRKDFEVAVYSGRCHGPGGAEAVADYLAKHEIEVDAVVNTKLPAILFVDDRGFRFNGDWAQLLAFVKSEAVTPWNRRES